MSDTELGGNGLTDDDLSLPKATVTKLIQEMMPDDIVCAKDTRDLLIDCCVEFIHLIASEANEICEKENKKTIGGEHVMAALESLGFQEYLEEVRNTFEDHKKYHKEKEKKPKFDIGGLTEEELQKQQESLFEEARLRMQAKQQ